MANKPSSNPGGDGQGAPPDAQGPKTVDPIDLGFSKSITHQKRHGDADEEVRQRPPWVQQHRPFWLDQPSTVAAPVETVTSEPPATPVVPQPNPSEPPADPGEPPAAPVVPEHDANQGGSALP